MRGIYATLPLDDETANLLFSTEDQDHYCSTAPDAFSPVKGGWGRMGYTTVFFSKVTVAVLREALRVAWTRAQPKPRKRAPR